MARIGNYRTGKSGNDWFSYADTVVPTVPRVEFQIDARFWFLCRKIHLVNYVNPLASTSPLDYQLRIFDKKRERYFQNIAIANNTVGGMVHSPNVLPAPILFEPRSQVQLELDRSGTRVYYAFEGEHLTDPDPAWVARMNRRYWFQYAVLDVPTTGTATLDMRDSEHDFAVFRVLSKQGLDGVLSNANPGLLRIREKGPKGSAWSSADVPSVSYAGAFANGAGPRKMVPPLAVPLPTTLEIITNALPNTGYHDLVFDGVKYPKGTRLEEWL